MIFQTSSSRDFLSFCGRHRLKLPVSFFKRDMNHCEPNLVVLDSHAFYGDWYPVSWSTEYLGNFHIGSKPLGFIDEACFGTIIYRCRRGCCSQGGPPTPALVRDQFPELCFPPYAVTGVLLMGYDATPYGVRGVLFPSDEAKLALYCAFEVLAELGLPRDVFGLIFQMVYEVGTGFLCL